jgi:hypothetical protein
MLEHLLAGDIGAFKQARGAVLARKKQDRNIVAAAEEDVREDPRAAFVFDAGGAATLDAAGHRWKAGRFETASIATLKKRGAACAVAGHRARLFALLGEDDATDIGALQASAQPASLFQVASQFNCLEAPGPGIVGVAEYLSDPTQGPRASISAFPGTLLRHYAAPGESGERFTQTEARQVNLLKDAIPAEVGRVLNGYLMTHYLGDLHEAARVLDERFEQIAVGVHSDVEVALGALWDGGIEPGRTIGHVLTSTLAVSYSRGVRSGPDVQAICRQLLRASYLGTLLAAATLNQRTAVLTLIGGGVFGNPHALIWESIEWAVDEVDAFLAGPLDVVVNCRDIDAAVQPRLRTATARRGGAVYRLDADDVVREGP